MLRSRLWVRAALPENAWLLSSAALVAVAIEPELGAGGAER